MGLSADKGLGGAFKSDPTNLYNSNMIEALATFVVTPVIVQLVGVDGLPGSSFCSISDGGVLLLYGALLASPDL